MALWAVIAAVVQIVVYLVVRLLLPDVARHIPEGKVGAGVFLGAVTLATGILNAACMTYWAGNATTFWRCSPRPLIVRVMTSPGLRNTGSGLMPKPTPGGVPVAMTSPGSRVM
jgi:hypothetical protein